MHPKHLSIKDFAYELPEDKIARYPLAERDSSKLLIYRDNTIKEANYKHLDQYIPANSILVLNDTKVIEARLLFQKPTGGTIEIFCLEPAFKTGEISAAMLRKGSVEWLCLIGGASKWKRGQVLQKTIKAVDTEVVLEAKFIEKLHETFAVLLSWTPAEYSFAEILYFAGHIPLPPYLKREEEITDRERYQTVYADSKGSVAAPTAGLHFTPDVFSKLHAKGILSTRVTLHVGAGTFKPVKAPTMETHDMHAEFLDVDIGVLKNILENLDRFVLAVGTTSLRTIESLYWIGCKVMRKKDISADELEVQQWEPYEQSSNDITAHESLKALLEWLTTKNMSRLITKTKILIAPGYHIKIANALITNFHQPHSTLLLLVAAFIGEDWRNVYDYALRNNFRFLSYGDGCLLFRNNSLLE